MNPLPMANKKFHVVLLVGGPRDLAREIRDKLAICRDVLVKYHWEYDKDNQWDKPIPADVDFVIGLKDMMSHSQYYKMKDKAKAANKRWVLTQRKLSTLLAALQNHGIRSSVGIPLEIRTTTVFGEKYDLEPKTKEPEPPKLVKEVIPPAAPETDTSKVSIFVSPVAVPPHAGLEPRRGMPRAETMILIAALQRMVQDDHIMVMVTPNNISIEPIGIEGEITK